MWSKETKEGLLRHNDRLIMVDSLGSSEAIGMATNTTTSESSGETAKFELGPSTRVVTDDGRDVEERCRDPVVHHALVVGRLEEAGRNDLEADEKIKVYDKGVTVTNREGVYDLLVSYRSGDVWAPKVEQTEALKVELGYFLQCIESGATPFNDGQAGLRVVRMLEAADRSLAERGKAILW